MSSYNLNNQAWVLNGAYVPGFSEGDIPSSDISWFTTDQFDMGIDFSSLKIDYMVLSTISITRQKDSYMLLIKLM